MLKQQIVLGLTLSSRDGNVSPPGQVGYFDILRLVRVLDIGRLLLGFDCIVCVKQVPDTSNKTGDVMNEDGTVNRAALPTVFNPEDLHALEAAFRIKEEYGGSVTVLTMGPPNASDTLRESLFRGADRVLLLTDRRAAGSDTLATSYILSRAIQKIERYDLVFCGRQAIDGDTAQVGPQLAEKLGIPQVTYYEQVLSMGQNTARVRRNIGNGWEIVDTPLPALFTVLDTANVPAPPAARRVMRYKRAQTAYEVSKVVAAEMAGADADRCDAETARRVENIKMNDLLIDQWDLDDIEADMQWCGLAGSPTKVHRVQSIVLTKEGFTEVPATDQGVREMIHGLIVDHTLG